jgi:hypothetical protein
MVVGKRFIVFRKSENTNSFGLYQMYLMAKDGEAYKSCASQYSAKQVGEVIQGVHIVNEITGECTDYTFQGHELTERLNEDAPADVIEEVWKLELQK